VKKRFDYLPFGEELLSGYGNRTTPMGYNDAMSVTMPDKQSLKFTGKERDAETGLDYFGARYFSGTQGRWTSPDPKAISRQRLNDPQQWNMYSYARNNPLQFVDPDGKELRLAQGADASKIIPALAHAYTKADFRPMFDELASSKNVHFVNNVDIPQDPEKESHGTVTEGQNRPRPADPSEPISNTNLVNTIELDNRFVFGKGVTPEGQDFPIGHEFTHAVEIDRDPAKAIRRHNNPTESRADEHEADAKGIKIENQKSSISIEQAKQAVQKALGCSTDSSGKTTCKIGSAGPGRHALYWLSWRVEI
jgi:RHS repeat-associated protein